MGVGVILCFVFSGNNVIQAYMDIILEAGGADPTIGGALYASTQLLLACRPWTLVGWASFCLR